MHGTSRTKPAEKLTATGINAVVWIEPGRALIVRGGEGAETSFVELSIPTTPAVTPPALAEVAHSIGAVDRVLVLGMDELRIALEREIVAIGHRPEAIRDAEVSGPPDEAALVQRLADLRYR